MAGEPGRTTPGDTAPAVEAGSEPARRRAMADGCFERREFVTARKFYLELLENGHDSAWCQYQLGRIDSGRGEWRQAIERFDAALAANEPYVWNHFEKAAALARQEADPREIANELISFVRGSPAGVNETHYRFVHRHSHRIFDAGLHEEAGDLYDWLAEREQGGFVCGLRRAMLRLRNNDPRSALRILRTLKSHDDDDFRVPLLKARALLALDRAADAVVPLKFVVARSPGNAEAMRLLFSALERDPEKRELREPDELLRGFERAQRFEFLLRAKIACEDHAGAAKLCGEHPLSVTAPHAPLIARALYAAVQKGDFASADLLFERAGGLQSNAPRLVAAQVTSHLQRKELEAARRLLDDAEPLLAESGDPELRHRKLIYLCASMQLEEASRFLAVWKAEGGLPQTVAATVAGLHSARGEWNELLDFLRERISADMGIAHDVLLDSVARAARATGRYQEVLDQLQELLQRAPDAKLSDFRDRLLCEQILIAQLGGHEPGASLTGAIANPYFAKRAGALSHALSRPGGDRAGCSGAAATPPFHSVSRDGGERVEGNIYFCSDLNYFVGTAVALFSLLQNNLSVRGRCAVSVVCEDEILDFASEICGRIGAAFGVPVRMMAARALLGAARDLKSQWGLFTAGFGLSDAAYFRIFAAQQMLAEGLRGRALYIDSDTCVGGGVEQILSFGLEGHPLGARPETGLPEIAAAAVRLGIEPGKYFNSGVLLFDLDHPDLAAALAQAVEISINQKELLTFVDQCALNLAFRGRNAVLPETFNCFVRESTPIEAIPPDPAILHFLARPKPWDPMYSAVHCMRWVREFLQLAELLTPELRKRLLASQFASVRPPALTITANNQTTPSPALAP